MLSNRTKRRRIKNEIDINLEQSQIIKNKPNESNKLIDQTESFNIQSDISNASSDIFHSLEILNNKSIIIETTQNISPVHYEDNNYNNSLNPIYSEETCDIKRFLGSWAIQFNVPHNTINALLKGLKLHKCFNNLPVDSRTLLSTPKHTYKTVRCVQPGSYYHFGLTGGILRHASANSKEIKLAIGIDGLPISKSSGGQFWPIMAYIIDSHLISSTVFPVGLYYGNLKPNDSNDYLQDFVKEMHELLTNGINFNNSNLKVFLNVFCCDAPAKAFILKIKGHSGFSSCSKCHIEGEYRNNRVCFPYSSIKSALRTHESYISISDEDHHTHSRSLSILSELPNIDIVNIFSIDYMHLVCLGVMKKLLTLWMSKGPLNVRIRGGQIQQLTQNLLEFNRYIPSDFARKARELSEVSRWKATEFRSFLLYFGPIVLKNILNYKCYIHFMALSISMTILLSPDHEMLIDYVQQLLDYFVKQFEILYGVQFLSHNVHGLLHLCDVYKTFGPLDNCCAFKFENYMKELKSLVRKNEKPLEQVVNRYSEKNNFTIENIFNSSFKKKLFYSKTPILKQEHADGPLTENCTGSQYKSIFFKNLRFKVKGNVDCFALTKNKVIIKCLNIVYDKCEVYLIGKYFKSIKSLYNEPIESSILNVYQVNNLSNRIESWNISEIHKKMMILKYDSQLIAMPIIHSSNE